MVIIEMFFLFENWLLSKTYQVNNFRGSWIVMGHTSNECDKNNIVYLTGNGEASGHFSELSCLLTIKV